MRLENLEELVGVAREYDAMAEEASVEEFLQQIALFSEQDNLRDEQGMVTLMTLHNAKGLEFGTVFIIGMEDGVFPHIALDRGGRPRGGAPAGLRRHHAREARALPDLRAHAGAVRQPRLEPAQPLHRRDPDRAHRPRGAGTGGPEAASTWGGAAAAAPEPTGPGAIFALGDDVVHAQFGEGVVVGVEPGGLVVVRFAGDGSERKLMADYAPLKKRS